MIAQLSSLGYHPIRRKINKYDWIRRIANIYRLWMALCCVFHILPLGVRAKIKL